MDNDHVKIICRCGKRLRAPANFKGRRLRCPGCGQSVLVEESPVEAIIVENEGKLSTPFAKTWIGVAAFLMLAVAFVTWHAWSTKKAKVDSANVRLTAAMKAAESWILSGSMDQFDAVENELLQSLSNPLADGNQQGELTLERLRVHREHLLHPAPAPTVPETPVKAAQVSEYKELAPYLHAGTFVRSYLVPSGTKAESLVDASQTLHLEYPKSRLQFFDDAAQYDEFRKCDELYLHLRKKPTEFPTDWFTAHFVGKVQETPAGTWEFVDLNATIAVTMNEPKAEKQRQAAQSADMGDADDASVGPVRTGSIVRLRDDTFLASDEETLSRVTRLSLAKDTEGIMELMLSGRLAFLEKGTKVRVIDPGFITSEIRALSGPVKGRSGFVVSEAIR